MSEDFKKKTLGVEIVANILTSKLLKSKNFLVYRKEGGLNMPIKVCGNECELYEGDDAYSFIKKEAHDYVTSKANLDETYKNVEYLFLSDSNARAITKTLLLSNHFTPKIPIKTFAFKSDPSLAFCRLPFDAEGHVQETPTWDQFMDNFTNPEAVMMWIGSVFFAESDRSQYLWFYGKGSNGKSTLSDIFKEVLGSFARAEVAPYTSSEKQFWTYGLIGKRLITIDECASDKFVTTPMFKSCTGSSLVRVEQKGESSHNTTLDCKFLFTSNEKPRVSDSVADQRRLILTTAKNSVPFAFDPTFKPRLRAEFGAFVSNCMLKYKEMCPNYEPIPTDNCEAAALGESYYEDIEAWFEENFQADALGSTKVCDFNDRLFASRFNEYKVRDYLEKCGFKKYRKREGGINAIWQYSGFKIRSRFYVTVYD